MKPILEVEDLNVRFSLTSGILHAVRGISFDVLPNEILAIVGESGCGKSMTALSVMDLLHRRARREVASMTFLGQDISKLSAGEINKLRGDKMSMIFQEPMTSLNPVHTIGDQLEEVYLRHRKADRAEARQRALFLLGKVGIPAPEQRLRQYPHQLSGGLRQRVMIAMALMCEPELIIADEPTTALDVTIQAQVLALLKQLQREFAMSVILITHDLGVVARMADRVLVMYAGEIVEAGPTAKIFNDPRHPYTQGLLDCLPHAAGSRAPGARLGTIAGVVPSLIGEMKGCAFANRCPKAFDACTRTKVGNTVAGPDHEYRCLLSADRPVAQMCEAIK